MVSKFKQSIAAAYTQARENVRENSRTLVLATGMTIVGSILLFQGLDNYHDLMAQAQQLVNYEAMEVANYLRVMAESLPSDAANFAAQARYLTHFSNGLEAMAQEPANLAFSHKLGSLSELLRYSSGFAELCEKGTSPALNGYDCNVFISSSGTSYTNYFFPIKTSLLAVADSISPSVESIRSSMYHLQIALHHAQVEISAGIASTIFGVYGMVRSVFSGNTKSVSIPAAV